MEVTLEPEAKEDLREIGEPVRQKIVSAIEELEENPVPENSDAIKISSNEQVQRLKLQEEDRNSKLNHRILYDIENGEIKIYGIWHRQTSYTEMKNKTSDRK